MLMPLIPGYGARATVAAWSTWLQEICSSGHDVIVGRERRPDSVLGPLPFLRKADAH